MGWRRRVSRMEVERIVEKNRCAWRPQRRSRWLKMGRPWMSQSKPRRGRRSEEESRGRLVKAGREVIDETAWAAARWMG